MRATDATTAAQDAMANAVQQPRDGGASAASAAITAIRATDATTAAQDAMADAVQQPRDGGACAASAAITVIRAAVVTTTAHVCFRCLTFYRSINCRSCIIIYTSALRAYSYHCYVSLPRIYRV